MTLDQVPKFEVINGTFGKRLHVGAAKKDVQSGQQYVAKKMNLLLIYSTYEESPNVKLHYVWIKT